MAKHTKAMHAAPAVFFLMGEVFVHRKEAVFVAGRGTKETWWQQPVGGVLFDCWSIN